MGQTELMREAEKHVLPSLHDILEDIRHGIKRKDFSSVRNAEITLSYVVWQMSTSFEERGQGAYIVSIRKLPIFGNWQQGRGRSPVILDAKWTGVGRFFPF